MLNIDFAVVDYFLGSIKLELDIAHDELVSILEEEEWIDVDWRTKEAWKGYVDWSKRFEVKDFSEKGYKNSKLTRIIDFIQSDAVHDKALDLLYTWPQFSGLWGMDKAQLKEFAFWHAHFHKDLPGYYIPPHTDYRRLIATGLIMLTEQDSADTSTTFMWEGKEERAIRMRSGYGDGWLHVNTQENIHTGHNKSNKDRYSIMVGLTIKHVDDLRKLNLLK